MRYRLNGTRQEFTLSKTKFSVSKIKRVPTVVVRGDILSSWLTISNYSKSQIATELGISRGRVSQLLTSHEEPSAHLIAKLMTVTGLSFDRLFMILRTSPRPHNHRNGGQSDAHAAALQAAASTTS